MRVRYKKNREQLVYETQCLTTTPHKPPPTVAGPQGHCAGCPYPGHGFVCWHTGVEQCLRTDVARIMERDKSVGSAR